MVITTTIEKTIVSTSVGSDIFKYFDTDTMLVEVEAGYARNEPVTFALRKAIEKGVVDLIHEGILKDLWAFEIEEVILPIAKPTNIEDYMDTTNDIHIDIGDKKKEKTYEEYVKEKEAKNKVLTETEKELEKQSTEKEWEEVDKQTEENADEKDNDGDGDSSSDTK